MHTSSRAIAIGTTAAAAVVGVRLATDQALPAPASAALAPAPEPAPEPASEVPGTRAHSAPSAAMPQSPAAASSPRLEMATYLAPGGMSSLLSTPGAAIDLVRAGAGLAPWSGSQGALPDGGAAAPLEPPR